MIEAIKWQLLIWFWPKKAMARGYCPKRKDKTHCIHWWDGEEPCCNCGDNQDEEW